MSNETWQSLCTMLLQAVGVSSMLLTLHCNNLFNFLTVSDLWPNTHRRAWPKCPENILINGRQEPDRQCPTGGRSVGRYAKIASNIAHISAKQALADFKPKRGISAFPRLADTCLVIRSVPSAGHVGRDKTYQAITRHFWWPLIRWDVNQYVQTCKSCQPNKTSTQKPAGLLQLLPLPTHKWTDISMDFITQLPKTQRGHDAILVVVDRCTKMCHFIPTRTSVDAVGTAQLFIDHIFRLHGMPNSIVSDRDTRFTSHFLTALCHQLQIKQKLSTAFHPQTDGQTERMNRTLEEMLRHFVGPDQDDWDMYLSQCEFAHNNNCISGTDTTPFFLNYGYHPKVLFTRA
jgi:hypothetical protein